MRHRDTHYFLWFIFFGVVAGLIHYVNSRTFDPESTWLTVSGLLGILLGMRWVAKGRLERWYDLIIGAIFTLAGVLGITAGFLGNVAGLTSQSELLGLSLGVLPSLVHTVLGLTSLSHGVRNK
ncbi:MAG TPA: hypothetical protein VF808_13590 [Ktedonobacterales bacterium]